MHIPRHLSNFSGCLALRASVEIVDTSPREGPDDDRLALSPIVGVGGGGGRAGVDVRSSLRNSWVKVSSSGHCRVFFMLSLDQLLDLPAARFLAGAPKERRLNWANLRL